MFRDTCRQRQNRKTAYVAVFFLRYTVIGTGQPSADTNVQRERTEGRCQGVKRSGIRS